MRKAGIICIRGIFLFVIVGFGILFLSHHEVSASASYGTVSSYQKISDTQGSFTGTIGSDWFGSSLANIGDLDNDGVNDIAVGAVRDPDGGALRGAVWILFLNWNGTVKNYQKISDVNGNFTGVLDDLDYFGSSVTGIGDLDGDSVEDIVVGAKYDDDGGSDQGAIWVLFLNTNGTVKSHQKISPAIGGFTGVLDDGDLFGGSVSSLGDIDGDTVTDIVVGAPYDDDGGSDRGALWILFLNTTGTVKSFQKISDTQGGFTGTLSNFNLLGYSVSQIGDINNNGTNDIAVGAIGDSDGGILRGAVWILFLNSSGSVSGYQKISDTQGGFSGTLVDYEQIGSSVVGGGDMNGDTVRDIIIGGEGTYNGIQVMGGLWVLFLNSNGTVSSYQRINNTQGNFGGSYQIDDFFGNSLTSMGDINGDKMLDIVVGARGDDDGGADHGAVWNLFLNSYFESTISGLPSGVRAVLTSDWTTDVSLVGQNGIVEIGIIDANGRRIAKFQVDFSADRYWDGLIADSTENQSLFHYVEGFINLPGVVGSSYVLYIPKSTGSIAGICEGAVSLEEVGSFCSSLYLLDESSPRVTVVNEGGIEYWNISGLSGTGGFSTGGLADTGQAVENFILLGLVTMFAVVVLMRKDMMNMKTSSKIN